MDGVCASAACIKRYLLSIANCDAVISANFAIRRPSVSELLCQLVLLVTRPNIVGPTECIFWNKFDSSARVWIIYSKI